MEFRFRKGRDIDLGLAPASTPVVLRAVRSVGLVARDFPGVSFDLRVGEGDLVRRGQVLCVDRLHPDIAFVAGAAGRISQTRHGARRRIEGIEIATEGDEESQFSVEPARTDDAALRALLLRSGAWVAFRSRPFGRVPAPADRPSAIFVTATDTNPLAPVPAVVLAPKLDSFRRGAEVLQRLTDGPVFICQAPGPPLAEPGERLRVARFSGPHPAGLAGTHIHHLWPVSSQRSVWQIGYQDVAAIGDLLAVGRITAERTLSVAGPGVSEPALVRAPLGSDLRDLLGEKRSDKDTSATRLISGSILSGREARFLGRQDLQVTVLKKREEAVPARALLWGLLARLPRAAIGATLPSEGFERVFPLDLLPTPLMRALAVGDVETTERLGGLELLEEDLALLSWRCPSGSDYGALLRHVLDGLDEERAA
ncbi:NADH:ubiquinone reductase (Na(+)-transporting) subunit A [Puniceibacterium confluentis]|uniref:NADH:ubiquinone reductase (Na(+)-transporting) subunit A n=1 Tax=Puniceibacterium confluentis TaxID=1958944 RepID=UPI0011B3A465|nr:NADH:ubiquinone reductase (Na(+)-transporting) subunit A [Puniceibacterium confluentis]